MRRVKRNGHTPLSYGYAMTPLSSSLLDSTQIANMVSNQISDTTYTRMPGDFTQPLPGTPETSETLDPFDGNLLQDSVYQWMKKPDTRGLESLMPEWYQSPMNLSLRPYALGIYYMPEIFGQAYFPGQEVSDEEAISFLMSLQNLYCKLYSVISQNPELRGRAGIDELLKLTVGNPEFVKETGVLTPIAILCALQPFIDPFYTLSEDGYPLLKYENSADLLEAMKVQYPELALAYQEALTTYQPGAIPVSIVAPALASKLTELSEALGLDAELALMGQCGVPLIIESKLEENKEKAELEEIIEPPEEKVTEAPKVLRAEESFIEKNWLLLALIGGGLYLKSQGKI